MSDQEQDLFEQGGAGKAPLRKIAQPVRLEKDPSSQDQERKPFKLVNRKPETAVEKDDSPKNAVPPPPSPSLAPPAPPPPSAPPPQSPPPSRVETEVLTDERFEGAAIRPESKHHQKTSVQQPQEKPDEAEKPHRHHQPARHTHEARAVSHGDMTPGQMLQEARVRKDLGLDQVSIRTKIAKQYLEAIERNEFSNLPAPVFTTAYVRALCDFYGIGDRAEEIIRNIEFRQRGKAVPEAILEQIHKGRQVNEEEEKKISAIVTGVLVSLLGLVLLASLAYLYQHYSRGRGGPGAGGLAAPATAPVVQPSNMPSVQDKETESRLNKEVSLKIKENFQYPQFIIMTEVGAEVKKK